jgi:predicted nucleic acid-binding protein
VICIPTVVLNEFFHKLMVAELMENDSSMTRQKALHLLKHNSSVHEQLKNTFKIFNFIMQAHFLILDYTEAVLKSQSQMSLDYKLMATDAAIVAIGIENDIFHLATNDSDFDQVPCLKIWKP